MLGQDGTVQYYIRGTKTAASVNPVVESFLAGSYSPDRVTAKFGREQRRFRQSFDKFERTGVYAQAEPAAEPEMAKFRYPETFKMTELWNTTELNSPGNIYVVSEPGGEMRFLVAYNAGQFALLNGKGEIVAKSARFLPDRDRSPAPRFARSAVVDGKRMYAVFSPFGSQIHLLDEALQSSGPSPVPSKPELEVCDLRFTESPDDKAPRLLLSLQSTDGTGRLALVKLDGTVLWATQSVTMPAQIGVLRDGDQPTILAMNLPDTEGTIKKFSFDGKFLREIALDNGDLISWMALDEGTDICTKVSEQDDDNMDIVGLDATGKRLWQHPFPNWQLREPVEPIVCGDVTGNGVNDWLIPASDGTLHILDKRGNRLDEVSFGAPICGVAVANVSGKRVLLVSNRDSITAWEIE
jgi:hypothetical protein